MQYKFKAIFVKNNANELDKLLADGWDVIHAASNQTVIVYVMRKQKNA